MTVQTEGNPAPGAVPAAPNNPAQEGPAIPNVDRVAAPADPDPATPATTPAPADPAPAPAIGDPDPAPDADPAISEAGEDGVITYAPTGDAGMDLALDFVGRLGIDMDHPAMAATANGDWSLIEAHLASLGDKARGWEKMVEVAKAADARLTASAQEATDKINTAVSGVLGEAQADILAWAAQEATPEEKAELNAMLKASPLQAQAAATILLNLYQAASGTVVTPTPAAGEHGGANPDQNLGPITNRIFADKCAELARQYGSDNFQNTTEYQALVRRLG